MDKNLFDEIEFYKTEITRLQGEINLMKHKMMANQKSTKAALKQQTDSKNTTAALEKTLKESRDAFAGAKGQLATLKAMNDRTSREHDHLVSILGRMRITAEKKDKYEKMTEKMIDKIYVVNSR